MKGTRPEAYTGHNSNWQFGYGITLEEIMRAGTAPQQEEKKAPKRPNKVIQRPRQLMRAKVIQSGTRPKYTKATDVITNLKLSDFVDDFEDKLDLEYRLPCRQNVNLFDLDDSFHPKFNGFIKDSARNPRNDLRPPSRHKTPPKALGLELPPKKHFGDFIPVENMFQHESSLSELDNESFSNTMPTSLKEPEKTRKEKPGQRDSADSFEAKNRPKPRSAKGKPAEKQNIRIWSAATNPKKKLMEVPIVLNKKEANTVVFSRSHREKSKIEEEKILIEEKKKIHFKKTSDKRAQTSNKAKLTAILPFQSSLEPEFLNLFAKGEEFNF